MTYYICQRNNQCKKPCHEDCLYTHDFKKSKLFYMDVKPEKVKLIQDKQNNWYEVDFNWDKNLPVAYRKQPKKIIEVPYEYIAQIEVRRLLVRNMLGSK